MVYTMDRKELDYANREQIVARDKGRCVLCGNRDYQIHEIVPRSRLGKLQSELLFAPKNRVCLCVSCHAEAHNFETRKKLLELMQRKHGYIYDEDIFRRYF